MNNSRKDILKAFLDKGRLYSKNATESCSRLFAKIYSKLDTKELRLQYVNSMIFWCERALKEFKLAKNLLEKVDR